MRNRRMLERRAHAAGSAGLRDDAQQEARGTLVEHRAGALDDAARGVLDRFLRKRRGQIEDGRRDAEIEQPAHRLLDRARVCFGAEAGARAESDQEQSRRAQPAVRGGEHRLARLALRARREQQSRHESAQAPVGHARATAQRALIAEETRDRDLGTDARQRFGVADLERERRPHDASAAAAPSVCATASRTPLTKDGEGSEPKRRASSTASSIATVAGRPAQPIS